MITLQYNDTLRRVDSADIYYDEKAPNPEVELSLNSGAWIIRGIDAIIIFQYLSANLEAAHYGGRSMVYVRHDVRGLAKAIAGWRCWVGDEFIGFRVGVTEAGVIADLEREFGQREEGGITLKRVA